MASLRQNGAKTGQERQAEARQEKLAHVDEQVASGQLVIRKMTTAEKDAWAKRRGTLAANSTPAEQASRAAAVENRRKRAEGRR